MKNKIFFISTNQAIMNSVNIFCFLSCLLVISQSAVALPFRSDLNRGNDFYKKGDYPQAGQVYNKILQKKANDQRAKFNLGDSYKEGKYKESQIVFEDLAGKTADKGLRQASYYNLGNSFFKQEGYKSAIDAYEEALKIDPKDKDAQFNLDLAKKMLVMPKQEKEKNNEKQKKEDEKKENQKKEQEKPNDKSGNKDKEKEQNQQKQTKPGQMSKEDALRILNALEDKEKHKTQKMKGGRGSADVKDW